MAGAPAVSQSRVRAARAPGSSCLPAHAGVSRAPSLGWAPATSLSPTCEVDAGAVQQAAGQVGQAGLRAAADDGRAGARARARQQVCRVVHVSPGTAQQQQAEGRRSTLQQVGEDQAAVEAAEPPPVCARTSLGGISGSLKGHRQTGIGADVGLHRQLCGCYPTLWRRPTLGASSRGLACKAVLQLSRPPLSPVQATAGALKQELSTQSRWRVQTGLREPCAGHARGHGATRVPHSAGEAAEQWFAGIAQAGPWP